MSTWVLTAHIVLLMDLVIVAAETRKDSVQVNMLGRPTREIVLLQLGLHHLVLYQRKDWRREWHWPQQPGAGYRTQASC